MIRRTASLLVCAVGVLLPWRARIVYAEAIAWTVQGVYSLYFSLFRWLVSRLRRPGTPQ